MGTHPPFPDCDCLVRDPGSYPWHDQSWRPPAPRDLVIDMVIDQLHFGVFHAVDAYGRDTHPPRPRGAGCHSPRSWSLGVLAFEHVGAHIR
jgi:hypothetical protein